MKTMGNYFKGMMLFCITPSVFSYDELQLVATTESRVTLGDDLTIRCGFTGESKNIALPYIRLYSVSASGNKTEIAEVTWPDGVRVADHNSSSIVTGLVDKDMTSSSYLQYNISSVSCGDLTTYYCSTAHMTRNGTTLYLNASVDAYADPTDLMASTFPNKTEYPVGAEVTITCEGVMGRPEEEWFWYKYDTASKTWQLIRTNAVQNEAMQVSDCTFKRHSNYTFKITDEGEHMFSCTAGSDVEGSLYITVSRETSCAESLKTSTMLFVLPLLHLIHGDTD